MGAEAKGWVRDREVEAADAQAAIDLCAKVVGLVKEFVDGAVARAAAAGLRTDAAQASSLSMATAMVLGVGIAYVTTQRAPMAKHSVDVGYLTAGRLIKAIVQAATDAGQTHVQEIAGVRLELEIAKQEPETVQ